MATRMSLRYLTAAAVLTGLAFSLSPTTPAVADEDPYVRAPRARAPVRTVHHVRTVERVRTQVVCFDYAGQQFDCRNPAPVYYYTTGCGGCGTAVAVPAPVYVRTYAPAYAVSGCGGCGQTYAAPYYWAARYARYRYGY